MTLVAGLSIGGLPAFIGDLLLSWELRTEVYLPTSWNPDIYPSLNRDYAAGLAQKLIVVRPYLMIAWAGSHSAATRIVKVLEEVLPVTLDELAEPTPILDALNACPKGTELVALLACGATIQPLGVRTSGFELDGQRIYLLGSGASDFFKFLQVHPEAITTIDVADGLIARSTKQRFTARALTMQLIGGIGLENSWGGGFEIAYLDIDGKRVADPIFAVG